MAFPPSLNAHQIAHFTGRGSGNVTRVRRRAPYASFCPVVTGRIASTGGPTRRNRESNPGHSDSLVQQYRSFAQNECEIIQGRVPPRTFRSLLIPLMDAESWHTQGTRRLLFNESELSFLAFFYGSVDAPSTTPSCAQDTPGADTRADIEARPAVPSQQWFDQKARHRGAGFAARLSCTGVP